MLRKLTINVPINGLTYIINCIGEHKASKGKVTLGNDGIAEVTCSICDYKYKTQYIIDGLRITPNTEVDSKNITIENCNNVRFYGFRKEN